MATKRDLVEAHHFSRRRLVAAFLYGAPGGREVEAPRPGRALVAGVVLALVVVAGGAARMKLDEAETDKQDSGVASFE